MNHDEASLLASGFALDVLDAAERMPFEAHLSGCAICQAEVADLERVTAGLGQVEAVAPPASLKDRVMAGATKAAPGRAVINPGQVVAMPLPGRPASITTRAPVSRGPSWLSLAAAALVAVGLGLYAGSLRSQLGDAVQTISDYATRLEGVRDQLAAERLNSARLINTVNVLRAPDIIKVNLAGRADAPAATGRVYISASRGMVFETEQMPVLPAGKVYQLWIITGQQGTLPVSAGHLQRGRQRHVLDDGPAAGRGDVNQRSSP